MTMISHNLEVRVVLWIQSSLVPYHKVVTTYVSIITTIMSIGLIYVDTLTVVWSWITYICSNIFNY